MDSSQLARFTDRLCLHYGSIVVAVVNQSRVCRDLWNLKVLSGPLTMEVGIVILVSNMAYRKGSLDCREVIRWLHLSNSHPPE